MSTSGGSGGAHRLARFLESLQAKGLDLADLAVRIRNPIVFQPSGFGKRGDKEDLALHNAFQRIITRGTEFYEGDRFRAIQWTMRFLPKSLNIIGTQIADLAAYPVARFALDPKKANPAYEVIKPKFLRGFIKIFP